MLFITGLILSVFSMHLMTFEILKQPLIKTKKEGAHAQAAISYTISPVHTVDTYVKLAKDMESMGADSICIKDMSGLLKPYSAYELVGALKKGCQCPN